QLDLRAPLRLEVRVAEGLRRDTARAVAARCGRKRAQCGECVRLLARLAVRRTQLERVDEADVPERLLAHDPRRAHLRVDHEVEVLAERAIVVDAERAGQEEAIVPAE